MPTVSVSAPSGLVTTRRPLISWSKDFAGLLWKVWVVRYPEYVFVVPPESSGGPVSGWFSGVYEFPNGGWGSYADQVSSHTPVSDLPMGQLYAIVLVTSVGGWYWGTSPLFSFEDVLVAPTFVAPAHGATINTNLPLLQATVKPSSYGAPQVAEFQFATDDAFSANVRTVAEPLAVARTSGPASLVMPDASALYAASGWRGRCRSRNAGGTTSSWSPTHTFTVQHLPTCIVTGPTTGASLPWNDGDLTVTVQFSSTSPDMTITALQVIVEEDDSGDPVADTGKQASTSGQLTISGLDTGLKGTALAVKARVWDTEDVAGPYSEIVTVTMHDPPTVEVTAPTGEIDTPAPTVEATFTPSTGGPLAAMLVTITDDGDGDKVVYSSGWQPTTDPAISWPVPPTSGLATDAEYTTTVRVRDLLGIEASDSLGFTTEWTPPAAPTISVDVSTFNTHGPAVVRIDTSVVDAEFAGWLVRSRPAGSTAWRDVLTSMRLDQVVSVADYFARANTTQEWGVWQLANRYGVIIPSADADVTPVVATPYGKRYWLITDDNRDVGGDTPTPIAELAAETSMVLHVRDDQFVHRVEQAVIPIVQHERDADGQPLVGQKIEYGTDFGVDGQLLCVLADRPGRTAAEQRDTFVAFRAQRRTAGLRTPQRDVWHVALGDVQTAWLDAAHEEAALLTVPYTEISSG